jgi:hypothetical protein
LVQQRYISIEKIQKWLDEERLSIKPFADKYADYHVVAKVSPVTSLDIIIMAEKMDSVMIVQDVKFTDDDKKAFVSLDKTKKESISSRVEVAIVATWCQLCYYAKSRKYGIHSVKQSNIFRWSD